VLVPGGFVASADPLVLSGSGATYTVTVNGISGSGTLGLNLVDDGTIRDSDGNRLISRGTPPSVEYAAQIAPAVQLTENVFSADINGDDRVDLLYLYTNNDGFRVLLNNGDGTLKDAGLYATGRSPGPLTTADVNGDGRPDVIVVNSRDHNVGVF